MTTTNSSSTQTEERSSVGLLEPFAAGNSFAPEIDSNSATDNIKELFYPDDSPDPTTFRIFRFKLKRKLSLVLEEILTHCEMFSALFTFMGL